MNQKRKWFTLVEVIIIITIVSIGIITVITALTNWNKYLQKSREKIIAINLAREWVEQMLNIRDTNRKKNAWTKEASRLKTNPIDQTDNTRFDSGLYIIMSNITGGQQYFYWSWIWVDFNTNSWININNLQYALCKYTTWRKPCPWITNNTPEWYFFRRIRGLWLYKKDVDVNYWTYISCWTSPQSAQCLDWSAKEYRFCVDVDYFWQSKSKVEICSVLTNFKK